MCEECNISGGNENKHSIYISAHQKARAFCRDTEFRKVVFSHRDIYKISKILNSLSVDGQ